MKQGNAKLELIVSTLIFGSLGLFIRFIDLPSGIIAMVRGLFGAAALLLFCLAVKKKPDTAAMRRNGWKLLISGAFMGLNWILIFEAYHYTTVAAATLCYYLSPVFVTLVSPLILKEKLTFKKLICVLLALLGTVPVSGVLETGFRLSELAGIALALGAAVLYAAVIIFNKKLTDISAMDRTLSQLFCSGLVLIPYVLATTDFAALQADTLSLGMLAAVVLVHTALAYVLYFGSLAALPAQTAALISFVAVVPALLSSVILREEIGLLTVLGALLILGATTVGDLELKGKEARN